MLGVGIGRLGLCTALCLEKKGFEVLGVDIFSGYVDSLNSKTFKSDEPFVTDYLVVCLAFSSVQGNLSLIMWLHRRQRISAPLRIWTRHWRFLMYILFWWIRRRRAVSMFTITQRCPAF